MSDYTRPHVPKVVIRTPEPTQERPFTLGVLSRVLIDGVDWFVTSYRIESGVPDESLVRWAEGLLRADGESLSVTKDEVRAALRGGLGDQRITLTFLADVTVEH